LLYLRFSSFPWSRVVFLFFLSPPHKQYDFQKLPVAGPPNPMFSLALKKDRASFFLFPRPFRLTRSNPVDFQLGFFIFFMVTRFANPLRRFPPFTTLLLSRVFFILWATYPSQSVRPFLPGSGTGFCLGFGVGGVGLVGWGRRRAGGVPSLLPSARKRFFFFSFSFFRPAEEIFPLHLIYNRYPLFFCCCVRFYPFTLYFALFLFVPHAFQHGRIPC